MRSETKLLTDFINFYRVGFAEIKKDYFKVLYLDVLTKICLEKFKTYVHNY